MIIVRGKRYLNLGCCQKQIERMLQQLPYSYNVVKSMTEFGLTPGISIERMCQQLLQLRYRLFDQWNYSLSLNLHTDVRLQSGKVQPSTMKFL